jgi:hypothetical protein
MVITTATAVTNPRSNARLKITSMKPSLTEPSRNVNNPTCEYSQIIYQDAGRNTDLECDYG